jgi:two-component system, sensor histidine kinase and response regulator
VPIDLGVAFRLGAAETTRGDPLPSDATRGARILLAEDSATNRLLATAILKGAGYDVTAVGNGKELYSAARSQEFDLILMDIFMPEMDGLEATAAVRGLSGGRGQLPIIAMTAYAVESDRESCLAAGMNDYVSKPINKQELLETVARWLQASGGSRRRPDEAREEVLNPAVLDTLESDTGSEMVVELVRAFVTETAERLQQLTKAVGANDFNAIQREALALKTGAGTFGATRLYQQAEALELACLAGDTARALEVVRALPKSVSAACRALSERFDAAV